MCGLICILVGKWELVGIFSVPAHSQVFISKQKKLQILLVMQELLKGRAGCDVAVGTFNFIPLFLRAPVLSKKDL